MFKINIIIAGLGESGSKRKNKRNQHRKNKILIYKE